MCWKVLCFIINYHEYRVRQDESVNSVALMGGLARGTSVWDCHAVFIKIFFHIKNTIISFSIKLISFHESFKEND